LRVEVPTRKTVASFR
jgi:hypothetical protein